MQAHVLLISPPQSYRIAPYLEAARQLGIAMTVVSSGEHSLVSAIAEGIHIDFSQPAEALRKIIEVNQRTPIHAVISSDDAGVELASAIADKLGLLHNPAEAAHCSRRKDFARDILQQAGVAVPEHQLVDLGKPLTEQLQSLRYPCVLKPLAMSMSRGVIRVDNIEQAQQAVPRIQAILREAVTREEQAAILVEDYIDGIEVAYEGMLSHGKLQTLLLFDKPEPLTGPYFEETYYITPSRLPSKVQQHVIETVEAACKAYGLVSGPVHAELRIDKQNKAWVIEVAARTIGGECARLLELATGHSLEAMVIANALGKMESLPKIEGAAGVLMLPTTEGGVLRRVEGLMAAKQVKGIHDIVLSVREGHRLIPLPEGASYLGFMYALADTADEVEVALREAYSKIKVVVAPLFEIEDRR